jgi:hypothetical protein
MVPAHSTNLRQTIEPLASISHQGYLGMIKIINKDALCTKIKKAFRAEGFDKIVFEQQNEQFIFGFGTDLYTLHNESDLVQLLFGPLNINSLDFVSKDVQQKLSHLLPMPFWVWGWDSI